MTRCIVTVVLYAYGALLFFGSLIWLPLLVVGKLLWPATFSSFSVDTALLGICAGALLQWSVINFASRFASHEHY